MDPTSDLKRLCCDPGGWVSGDLGPNAGGDSSVVQDQLRSVQQVQSTWFAFAAILADGSVVTWGHVGYGGAIFLVKDQLKGCYQDGPVEGMDV